MKKIITLLTACLLWAATYANNVVISNVSLVNGGPNNIYVQFDLSWENSWRVIIGQANYDGVWVFFKYKTPAGVWQHLNLNSNTGADLLPAGIAYWRPVSFPTGAIIHRSATNTGTGTINVTGIRLAVDNAVGYDIELRSFAIEMVYIPPVADIHFGDGNGTNESFYAFHPVSSDNNYTKNNVLSNVDPNTFDDNEIESPNDFMINGGNADGLSNLPINNSFFPTCSAIWCMKYEITQGAYRDFLNTLTFDQQTSRSVAPNFGTGTGALTTSGNSRNYIEIRTPGSVNIPAVFGCDASGNNIYDEASDGEFIPCNYFSWMDLAAWLDWAGMSPMTEIHFERICRGSTSAGPVIPQFGEYAWGTTTIFGSAYTLVSPYTASETASNASTTLGNAVYDLTATGFGLGPVRNGIFATTTSNRVTSGAAFYGVMEMSGGMFEACVSVGTVQGRSFNKLGTSRGNGMLSIGGNADVPHWPGNVNLASSETVSSGEVQFAGRGTILRGGGNSNAAGSLRTSDRGAIYMSEVRDNIHGGRGVIVLAMY